MATTVERRGCGGDLHTLAIDGVYGRDEHGVVSFYAVPAPTTEEVERLVVRVCLRVERWLATQGYGRDDECIVDDQETMLLLQEASAAHRAALGTRAGKQTRRTRMLGGREVRLPPRCATYEG